MKKKICFVLILAIFLATSCVHYRYIPEERLKVDYNNLFRVEYIKTIGMPYVSLKNEEGNMYQIYPSNPDDNILIYIQLNVINLTTRDQVFGDSLSESYLVVDKERFYISLQSRYNWKKENNIIPANSSVLVNILFEVPRGLWLDNWKGTFEYTRPGQEDIIIYFRNRY